MMEHGQQLVKTLTEMSQVISSSHKKFGVYDSFQDLVLREGQLFIPTKKPKGIKLGKVKECYRNASLLALENEDFFYAEGYEGLPFEHAWVVNRDGVVID